MMFFDDSIESHIKNAIPALSARDLIGTFYLNPGAKWFDHAAWNSVAAKTNMEFANHSWTHSGAKNADDGEGEIAACNEYVLGLKPERKIPRLLSFAYPGGCKWDVPEEDKIKALKKYNLIVRPTSAGRSAGVHVKTASELKALVEAGISTGSPIVIGFHGVGGEWLSIDLPIFTELLDFVSENKSSIWSSDPVSIYKYEMERDSSTVRISRIEGSSASRISLDCPLDPLYDEPLTLSIQKTSTIGSLRISQAGQALQQFIAGDKLCFDAVPNHGEILIEHEQTA